MHTLRNFMFASLDVYLFHCVCMCVCVRARAPVCIFCIFSVCACVSLCLCVLVGACALACICATSTHVVCVHQSMTNTQFAHTLQAREGPACRARQTRYTRRNEFVNSDNMLQASVSDAMSHSSKFTNEASSSECACQCMSFIAPTPTYMYSL